MAEQPVLHNVEHTLDVKASVLGFKTGFTLDYGSTLLKIIFVTDIGDDIVRLHFTCLPREQLDQGLQLIKARVGDTLIPGQQVAITGVGCSQYKDLIESTLNIRIELASELAGYADGLSFLVRNFPLCDIVIPLSEEVKEYARTVGKGWASMIKGISEDASGRMRVPTFYDKLDDISLEPEIGEKVPFPLVNMHIGSSSAPLRIFEDGTFEWLDLNAFAGRSLLGSGSLLANTKSYEELVDLAQKGDPQHLNVHFNHVIVEDKGDAYDAMKIDLNLFALAHSIGKTQADFSREDLAAGAVSMVTESAANYYATWAKALRVKHIFFTGGICQDCPYVRDQIAKIVAYQSITDQLGIHAKPLFVKLGAYTAAIGALLSNRK